jgi:2-aminoethylphosphonate-pyruvate transaminase
MKTAARRWVLMNPGPVNVTDRVRQALGGADLCHREKEFSDLLSGVRKKLLKIFGIASTHTAVILTGSGMAAVESMLCSFTEKGKKILVLTNGVYGDRIRRILEIHDVAVNVLSSGPGDFPKSGQIETLLKNDRTIHGIAMVHHETSTGMLNPLAMVSEIAKKYAKTLLVDAISSIGAEPIDFTGIGFLAGSSGKCLHGYPGLSFVIVSKKEAKALGEKRPNSLYLDLHSALESEEKNETPFTPAVQIFYAFDQALNELQKEGLQKRIRLYEDRSYLLEQGFMKLGLRFLVPKERRSHVLTALWMPEKLPYEKLHDDLKKAGFIIYAGQSRFAEKIFRVSNLGDMPLGDLRRFLAELKKILKRRP